MATAFTFDENNPLFICRQILDVMVNLHSSRYVFVQSGVFKLQASTSAMLEDIWTRCYYGETNVFILQYGTFYVIAHRQGPNYYHMLTFRDEDGALPCIYSQAGRIFTKSCSYSRLEELLNDEIFNKICESLDIHYQTTAQAVHTETATISDVISQMEQAISSTEGFSGPIKFAIDIYLMLTADCYLDVVEEFLASQQLPLPHYGLMDHGNAKTILFRQPSGDYTIIGYNTEADYPTIVYTALKSKDRWDASNPISTYTTVESFTDDPRVKQILFLLCKKDVEPESVEQSSMTETSEKVNWDQTPQSPAEKAILDSIEVWMMVSNLAKDVPVINADTELSDSVLPLTSELVKTLWRSAIPNNTPAIAFRQRNKITLLIAGHFDGHYALAFDRFRPSPITSYVVGGDQVNTHVSAETYLKDINVAYFYRIIGVPLPIPQSHSNLGVNKAHRGVRLA